MTNPGHPQMTLSGSNKSDDSRTYDSKDPEQFELIERLKEYFSRQSKHN